MYNNFLYFDIETVGNYMTYDNFQENDINGSKLFRKKFETTSYFKDTKDINEAYSKYSGIFSPYGKIVCISVGYYNKSGRKLITSIKNEDERLILIEFSELLKKVSKKNYLLAGYGILNFDIPWVVRKMIKYDINVPDIINFNFKKPWELAIYDILDNIKLKSTYFLNLDEVCYELGVVSPKDKIDGSMVHQVYWDGGIDDVVHYCEKDVLSTMLICEKIFEYENN